MAFTFLVTTGTPSDSLQPQLTLGTLPQERKIVRSSAADRHLVVTLPKKMGLRKRFQLDAGLHRSMEHQNPLPPKQV